MGCELLNGILGACEYTTSGVERLWVANKSQISDVKYNTTGEVSGITFTATGETFYEIVPALDSCTYTDDIVISGNRRNFLHTINFGVGSLTPAVLTTLETIGLSNMIAIVKTSEGEYRLFGGSGSGLRTTVMTDASGTSAANDGAIAVSIAGNAKTKARFILDSVMTTLNLL